MTINRQTTTPLTFPRTKRNHGHTVLTSLPAGFCVPLAAFNLFREDACTGSAKIAFEMQETAEILMNPVNVSVRAYLVPFLNYERFDGSMDQLNRSYMGQPKIDGGAVVPFIETLAAPAAGSPWQIHKYLGLHAKPGELISTAYLEAYNNIWNFRARNRSPKIVERLRLTAGLAPAFWQHSRFQHIVPDFDQAVMDGQVALDVVNKRVAIKSDHKGTYSTGSAGTTYGPGSALNPTLTSAAYEWTQVYAELDSAGITVSLANLDLARKTQAFAKLRDQYNEHTDEWIIDMLMGGMSIPDQALKHPMLIGEAHTRFGMSKRYATDAGNLAESAVSGAAVVDMNWYVPKLHTGGVVMIIAEVLPEQLFERVADPFLHAKTVAEWPESLRDTLDPEKVVAVKNGYIDTDHATPNGTFGYAPLNHQWNDENVRVGGKFLRPTTNTGFDEVRQRLWAVENVNPILSEDFYVARNVHIKPFLDTVSDPFEAVMMGNSVIEGNTVFGGALVEATNNYAEVKEKAPVAKIVKG